MPAEPSPEAEADAIVGRSRPAIPWPQSAWRASRTAFQSSWPTRRAETSPQFTPGGAASSPASCRRPFCRTSERPGRARSHRPLPSGQCCFEVDRNVAEAIARASAAEQGLVVRREEDKAWVDLRAAVRAQLSTRRLGKHPRSRRRRIGGCTMHEPTRFHLLPSRRRAERQDAWPAIRPRLSP